MCLKVPLVSQREPRNETAVGKTSNGVAHHERFLQRRIERAGNDAICDVVARYYVGHSFRTAAYDSQLSSAEHRDESCIRSATVDPSGERIPPACRHNARPNQ